MQTKALLSTVNLRKVSTLDPVFQNLGPALVVNQNLNVRAGTLNPHLNPDIIVKSFHEKGLARSRNRALEMASGDICFLVDDDCRYFKNSIPDIKKAFEDHPEADVITFQILKPDGRPFKSNYSKRAFWHNRLTILRVSSIEIAFRRKKVEDAKIRFDERFGLNSRYPCSEENIFLSDAMTAGLKVLYLPIPIVLHEEESQGGLLTPKNLQAKGAMFYRIFGNFGFFLLVFFALKKKRQLKTYGELWRASVDLWKGFRSFKMDQRDILIIHTWGIGDWIFFSPALKELKKKFAHQRIEVLVGTKNVTSFVDLYPEVDKVHYKSVRKNLFGFALFAFMHRYRYQDVIFTSGVKDWKADLYACLFNSRHKVALKNRPNLPSYFLTNTMLWDPQKHAVENNFKLAQAFNSKLKKISSPFLPVKKKIIAKPKSLFIHPGCDEVNLYRRWPTERFAKIAKLWLEDGGTVSVGLGPDELNLEKYFVEFSNNPKFKVIKNKSLLQITDVMREHTLFLNSDSGLGHIAAAVGIPIVCIFGPGDSIATRPYSSSATILETTRFLPCKPCVGPNGLHGCKERPCLMDITIEQVWFTLKQKSKTSALVRSS